MAVRTYIPRILFFAKWFKGYVNDHSEPLKKYLGDGGFAAIQLILDLVVIIAEMIEVAHDPTEPWDEITAINTINSTQLNAIEGAIAKFYDTIGVTP